MSNINFHDTVAPRGFLEVIMTKASNGEVVFHHESENLVVNRGRTGMAHMWGGGWHKGDVTPGAQMGWVDTMKFGDRGHDQADPTLPRATDVLREQLFCEDEQRPIILAKTVAVDYPDGIEGQKVRFTCTIGAQEGNGAGRQGYSEAGMYRADGYLAAHKTFGLITKTPEFLLTFRWTFQF